MKPVLKFVLNISFQALAFLSLLALSSLPANAAETDEATDMMMWRMVWVDDFGAADLPHKDLAPHLEDFICSVTLHTAMIDGQLTAIRASAGCNGMGRRTYKRIVTPARTVETMRDGKPHYEVTPTVYKTQSGWSMTQVGCSMGQEIDGEIYGLNWISAMEGFLGTHAPKITHTRNEDKLAWVDESGTVLARFEKLPDISRHAHYWQLDPEFHKDDPFLAKYFGPTKISINFPKFSSHRTCERVSAPLELADSALHISGEISTYNCDEMFALSNGQRFPFTPSANAHQNILQRALPKVAQYTLIKDGATRRITLSDQDGMPLLHLISSHERPLRPQEIQQRHFDMLDDHEWTIEPSATLNAKTLNTINPMRIMRHHGYKTDGPKTQATMVASQDCVIYGLNLNGNGHSMNVYPGSRSWQPYDKCEGETVSEIKAQWLKAKNILFDDTHLIFYDTDWNEVIRARRGQRLESPNH